MLTRRKCKEGPVGGEGQAGVAVVCTAVLLGPARLGGTRGDGAVQVQPARGGSNGEQGTRAPGCRQAREQQEDECTWPAGQKLALPLTACLALESRLKACLALESWPCLALHRQPSPSPSAPASSTAGVRRQGRPMGGSTTPPPSYDLGPSATATLKSSQGHTG